VRSLELVASPAFSATADFVRPSRAVVRVLSGLPALEELDGRWDTLLARQPLPNPTLSSTWLRAAARWETGTPLVAVVEEGGLLLAGAALEVRHGGRFSPRVATWLGPARQLVSPDVLALPDRPEAAQALLAGVFEAADVISVWTQASGVAAQALAAVAPWRRVVRTNDRWLLPWPAPRLDYARERAAYEVRRALRRGARVEVRVVAEPAETEAALLRLFRVHRDRWRDRAEETPRFATTAEHRRWNRGVVRDLAVDGHVRIAEVLEDGRAVAGCLGFVYGHGGLGHTWAVRPGGEMRQPGHVAVLACVDALATAGATVMDLGLGSGGPNTPKARLGSLPDPAVAILAAGTRSHQRPYEALKGAALAGRRLRGAAARVDEDRRALRPRRDGDTR